MALGYCTECHQLMTIRPLGQKWVTRELDWAPNEHRAIVHIDCGGLVATDEETSTGTLRYTCVRHGLIFLEDTTHRRCEGSRKPIR